MIKYNNLKEPNKEGRPNNRSTLRLGRVRFKKWSQLAYAGESQLPIGIDRTAGSWPVFYLKRNRRGFFTTQDGKIIRFNIKCPDKIDFYKELIVVKSVLDNLTSNQKAIAEYWGDGPASKQWTPIIDRLIDTYNLSPVQASRVLSAVQGGMNDAFVITWYFKYLWDVPRPSQLDPNLQTQICTPKFPAFPSGHSVISGTVEVILKYFFPTEAARLKELAEENSISRLYGGVHFPSDLSEGLRLGRHIGRLIVETLRIQIDINDVPIDKPKLEHLNAVLNPPPYNQVIPYEARARLCDLPLLLNDQEYIQQ